MTVLEQLVAELNARPVAGVRAGSAASTPSLPYYTGPGGLFGVLGLDREIISTRVQPRGLASVLPARGTMDMNPLFPYLTGFLAGSGTNPDGVCDDGPTAGPGKSCLQTAQFGRYTQQTRTMEINRNGQRINRGEFQDLRFANTPILNTNGGITTPAVAGQPSLENDLDMRFTEVGIAFQNQLMVQLYTGNPANNSSGGGYREFPGLDILIGTGKVDAPTGTSCPSLNSMIYNYNYANVATGGGAGIVNQLVYMFRVLRDTAERTNLAPVSWVVVMRSSAFYEITKVWPCAYATSGCVLTGNNTQFVSANDQIAMRDDMRGSKYLLVDGNRVPVIIDDAIAEDTNTNNASVPSGSFSSDIYIIPMTYNGNASATFWEYLDYTDGAQEAINTGRMQSDYWTDRGQFLWHRKTSINWCIQFIAKIEPRLILRTPHLAARLTNVLYTPLIHERDPFTTDPYFVNGGVSTARTSPSYYKEWTGN